MKKSTYLSLLGFIMLFPLLVLGQRAGDLDRSFNYGLGENYQFNRGYGAEDGTVNAVVAQPDGKIILVGAFTSYNGVPRNRIARLNIDGSLDTSFNIGTGANADILTINLQLNGDIIIGGYFTSYNGFQRRKVARLHSDGRIDLNFDPGTGADNTIHCVILQNDGKILLGGAFNNFNGVLRYGLVRLNPNGSIDPGFNNGTSIGPWDHCKKITCVAIQTDNKIIISGSFYTFNGIPRNRLARLNPNGSLDTSFNVGSGAEGRSITCPFINAVAIQANGKILIGGYFHTYNNIVSPCLARINSNGSLDTTFDTGYGPNYLVSSIIVFSNGKILISGDFSLYNRVELNRIAFLNENGSLDTTFNIGQGANAHIRRLIHQPNGRILMAGDFNQYNGFSTLGIARIQGINCPEVAPIIVAGNISLCNGESTLLTSSQLSGNLWNTGDTTRSIIVTTPGEYTVRSMNNGCTTAYSGIVRINNATITPTISGDTTLCSGNTTGLASSSPTGNLWSTGDTTQFINVALAGNYSVRVINSGCSSEVSAPFRVVNAGPSPTVINFDTTSNRCLGARLQLTPVGTFAHYQWNTGERTRSIYTRTSGQYSVQVANSDSCFGLPSPPIFIGFDTNWCSVEIFRVGIDSITANVWADYYIWYLDGIQLLSSNTLKTIPIQGDGVYTFRAVNGGRTSPPSNPIVITSARKSINAPKLKLYPNPTTSIVNLTTSPEAESIAITNAVGQLVYTAKAQPEMELNLSNLASGVYMVQVQSSKGLTTQRLVIQ